MSLSKLAEYSKAVATAVGGLVTVVTAGIADKALSLDEAGLIVAAIGVVLTTLGVVKAPKNAEPPA